MGRIRPTLHGSQLRGAQLTLEEKAALAHRHRYVGLDFSLREAEAYGAGDPALVRALLARYGAEASTVGGVLGASLVAPDTEFEAGLAQVPQRAHAVAATGATRTGGGIPPRTSRPKEELWPVVVERIRRLDRALAGTGVRLGLEFLGVGHLGADRPYPFVRSMAEANALLDEAGAELVGLTLDSYHWYAAGGTLETIRQTPGRRIVLLHINDAKDVPRTELRDDDRLLPGEGAIPLADWLRAIDATGFDGFVALEVLGPRLGELDTEGCARIGMEALTRVFAAAGLPLR